MNIKSSSDFRIKSMQDLRPAYLLYMQLWMVVKRLCRHRDNFFKVYKIKSVLSLHSQGFLNFLVSLLRKILNTKILIASMKTLLNSETCTISRIKILLRHWSIFSTWSPLIGQGKTRPKYTCKFLPDTEGHRRQLEGEHPLLLII